MKYPSGNPPAILHSTKKTRLGGSRARVSTSSAGSMPQELAPFGCIAAGCRASSGLYPPPLLIRNDSIVGQPSAGQGDVPPLRRLRISYHVYGQRTRGSLYNRLHFLPEEPDNAVAGMVSPIATGKRDKKSSPANRSADWPGWLLSYLDNVTQMPERAAARMWADKSPAARVATAGCFQPLFIPSFLPYWMVSISNPVILAVPYKFRNGPPPGCGRTNPPRPG